MSEERFDIVFDGELVAGFAPATVADNLARLFKAPPETIGRLMDGGAHVLKRDADADTAAKYRLAMERAGARARLRPVPAAPAPAAPPATEAQLTVAPVGGDLLAAHERRDQPPIEVDTSHIRLVSAFAEPEDTTVPPPPAPDTSHLSVAEPGAELLPGGRDYTAPPPPDTSAITLAEPGAVIGPERAQQADAAPDISHLSLAPPGAALEELRPAQPVLTPDTSALELAPPD